MKTEEVQEQMKTLIAPVMTAVENCKSVEEILMLASIMITTASEIMTSALGKEAANELIAGFLNKE